MKLSDAIVLGTTIPGHGFNPMDWRCCLLGLANRAMGETINFMPEQAAVRWPWIAQEMINPPISKYAGVKGRVHQILTGMALEIKAGRTTLEQAVAWVASVEPKGEAREETIESEKEAVQC